MKDKDSKLLEEAYGKINEGDQGGFPFQANDPSKNIPNRGFLLYHDETSKDTQEVEIIKDGDYVTMRFDNSFSISKMPVEEAREFIRLLRNIVDDEHIKPGRDDEDEAYLKSKGLSIPG